MTEEQKTARHLQKAAQMTAALRDNQDLISACFRALDSFEDAMFYTDHETAQFFAGQAMEAFEDIAEEDRIALWVAPTKGGIFHTWQREILKEGAPGAAWDAYIRRSGDGRV